VLEGLENEAREAKKGLWADPAPIPPWVYRKARRGQSLDLSDLVPLNSETEYSGTSRGPPQLGAVEPVLGFFQCYHIRLTFRLADLPQFSLNGF
jgi:hypothetical protein